MSRKIDQNKHTPIDETPSFCTLADRVDEKKRAFFDTLFDLIPDEELACCVEEMIGAFLLDMEELYFTLGLRAGATITADYMREKQSKTGGDE